MSIDPKFWAATFTSELTVAGEHVPLDRVVARHSEAFANLRQLGLTWRGISALLARAGARRADGGLISADQLRVSFARVDGKPARSKTKPQRVRNPSQFRSATVAPAAATVRPPPERHSERSTPQEEVSDPQDVSGKEIETALTRLRKISSNGVKK